MSAGKQHADITAAAPWVAAYNAAKAEADRWTEIAAAARANIEVALGDAEVGLVDGQKAVSWSFVERSTLDSKKLREQLGEDVVAPFMRSTVTRQFRVTG